MTWYPIAGCKKQKRRKCDTYFAKKMADHRNSILKDWAIKYEPHITPMVPQDYTSPFDKGKCIFCLCQVKNKAIDEFRSTKDKGRMNIVNCNPCCGKCNGSKSDRCGDKLVKWIKDGGHHERPIHDEQKRLILEWYEENEKYMIIPDTTTVYGSEINYIEEYLSLDHRLNNIYKEFM